MKKVLRPGLGLCALTLLCWLLDFASVAGKGGYASSLKEGVLGAGRLLHFHATLSESTVYIYILYKRAVATAQCVEPNIGPCAIVSSKCTNETARPPCCKALPACRNEIK